MERERDFECREAERVQDGGKERGYEIEGERGYEMEMEKEGMSGGRERGYEMKGEGRCMKWKERGYELV